METPRAIVGIATVGARRFLDGKELSLAGIGRGRQGLVVDLFRFSIVVRGRVGLPGLWDGA